MAVISTAGPTAIREIDPIEEMRLRAWARRHYLPVSERDRSWHPVVLDEMSRKDSESPIKPR
ncbi:MAG: hypothetical protein KF777_20935 [Planctomycetaceae bacterium]|jgi:hypothetical protein|nr:hypothetical protein [Planctomycetaceae bacterium]